MSESAERVDLKACECGCIEAVRYSHLVTGVQVVCDECGRRGPIVEGMDNAAEEWSTRPAAPHDAAQTAPAETYRMYEAAGDRSCDNCASNEGGHYCLLFTCGIKNGNLRICKDWTAPSEILQHDCTCGNVRMFGNEPSKCLKCGGKIHIDTALCDHGNVKETCQQCEHEEFGAFGPAKEG